MLLALVSLPGRALADGDPQGAAPAPGTGTGTEAPEARRIEQQARAAAQQGTCETALYEAARLAWIDPARHAAVRADPAVAACAARAAEAAKAAATRAETAKRATALAALVGRSRVRVRTADRSVIGTLAGTAEGQLLVDAGGLAPAKIQLAAVRGVERSLGVQSSAAAGARWGALSGAALGVIATLALGRGGDEDDLYLEYTLLLPIAAGTIVGLATGAAMSAERWEPVARW
jgi:hypothetical protein